MLLRAACAAALFQISSRFCSYRLPIVQCIQLQGQTSPWGAR